MKKAGKETLNKETKRKIADFFKTHPNKDYCLADSEQGREICVWRNQAEADNYGKDKDLRNA